MWFRRDLRLGDNPALLEACAVRTGAAAVRARPGPVGSGRAVAGAPTSRALARSTRSGAAGRLSVRGDPVAEVVLAAREVGRLPRARRRRLRSLRPAARPRGRGGAGRARDRAGPHRVAVRRRAGPGDQRLRAPYKVYTPFSKAWAEHGWRGPGRRSGPRPLARLDDTVDDPDGPARRDRAARGRVRRPRGGAGGRSSTEATSATTTTTATGPTSTSPRTCRCTSSGARSTRARCSPTCRPHRARRGDLPQGAGLAGVLRRRAVPPPGDRARVPPPEFARMAYDEPGDGARRLARGAHRLPDRRRRHAPAPGDRLDAQPGADDRGELPGQGPAHRVAARRPATSCSGWSTATSPPTSTAGSGWPGCGTDAAPYFRVFNPTTQGRKFDPDGDYVRRWVPELATSTRPTTRPTSPVGYPDRRPRRGAPRGAGPVERIKR